VVENTPFWLIACDACERLNQRKLSSELKSHYDFIVCGSGSSGSVVARRLAENANVSVLLLEAGGDDDVPSIMEADKWPMNLGSERDWNFVGQPNPHLNGRSIPHSMGKVLGGGSSINVMAWARGHKNDWDFFASEAGDQAWSYESVLNIYHRIEDWHGAPDPKYRGNGLKVPSFKNAVFKFLDTRIRMVRPEVASVDITWSQTGAIVNGEDWGHRRGLLMWIATKEGGVWGVSVMHNMDLPLEAPQSW
jgi:choline dehydrogenase-like flavoprotein